jgi:hypothetical protein
MKIIDYTLAESNNAAELIQTILELRKDGWVAQGGVAFAQETDKHYQWYVQAMVKHEEHAAENNKACEAEYKTVGASIMRATFE